MSTQDAYCRIKELFNEASDKQAESCTRFLVSSCQRAPHKNPDTRFALTPELLSRVSYRQTVARELTHKRHLENVYVTSLDRISATDFLAGAYIPRANTYVNDMRGDSHDVTIAVIEIGRQIAMATTHQFLGVTQGSAFILRDMQFERFPVQHEIDWRLKETLLAHTVLLDSQYLESGALSQISGIMDFYVDARCVFRQSSTYAIQNHARYLKLRELMRTRYERSKNNNGGEPTDFRIGSRAALCTKCSVLDDSVCIGVDLNHFVATLQVDRNNLFFFDHDNDHVPGMLLLEGMRQLVLDICTRCAGEQRAPIKKIDLDFSNIAELDAPVYLVARVEHDLTDPCVLTAITIEARQSNRVSSTGVFYLR